MLYFAHGSYIDGPQMRVCCPGAELVGRARLREYRLCFPRWSKVRASAVAGIEPAKGDFVWGALYEISPEGLARLDLVEGYAAAGDAALNTSVRVGVQVEQPKGVTVDAETHVPVPMPEPGRPSAGYLMVLVRAGQELGFPEEYIDKFRAAEAEPLAA